MAWRRLSFAPCCFLVSFIQFFRKRAVARGVLLGEKPFAGLALCPQKGENEDERGDRRHQKRKHHNQ